MRKLQPAIGRIEKVSPALGASRRRRPQRRRPAGLRSQGASLTNCAGSHAVPHCRLESTTCYENIVAKTAVQANRSLIAHLTAALSPPKHVAPIRVRPAHNARVKLYDAWPHRAALVLHPPSGYRIAIGLEGPGRAAWPHRSASAVAVPTEPIAGIPSPLLLIEAAGAFQSARISQVELEAVNG